MRTSLVLLAFAGLLSVGTGCAHSYAISMRLTDQPIGPDYVIIQAAGANPAKQKVFDCYSKPDGTNWQPTCVRVDFRAQSGEGR